MSKYMSVLKLTPKDLFDCKVKGAYDIHRLVFNLFDLTTNNDHEKRKILFYDPQTSEQGLRKITIFSTEQPYKKVFQRYGNVETREIDDQFMSHENYVFALNANPVKSIHRLGLKNIAAKDFKKKVPIKKEEDLRAWLFEKEKDMGISFDQNFLSIKTENSILIQKKEKSYSAHNVLFSGRFKVFNSDLFKENIFSGFGQSKAFGFGLMRFKPITKML